MHATGKSPEKDWVRELESIMARLRGPGGCPWDIEQDHASLTRYLIEEAYEFIDAVEAHDDPNMAEELGDILLQVVFHAQIAREQGRFDLDEVAKVCCEKLISRHPHVFGDGELADAEAVLVQWEELKKAEAHHQHRTSALDGVPRHLPGLSQAEKTQKKAAKTGFDWPDAAGPLAKVHEEIAELQEVVDSDDKAKQTEEFGDLLFAMVNLSRHLDINPEAAMRAATAKFRRRFVAMEARVADAGQDLSTLDLAALDAHWDAVKDSE